MAFWLSARCRPWPSFSFNLLLGLLLGLGGRQLVHHVRNLYFSQVRQRQESEQKLKQQERDRWQAFYDLTATLSTTLNYQTVLETALDLGTRVMDDNPESADQMVSAALLFEEDHLKVGPSRRMGPNDQRLTLPGREGLIANALDSAEPSIGANPASDPELGRFASLDQLPIVGVPCPAQPQQRLWRAPVRASHRRPFYPRNVQGPGGNEPAGSYCHSKCLAVPGPGAGKRTDHRNPGRGAQETGARPARWPNPIGGGGRHAHQFYPPLAGSGSAGSRAKSWRRSKIWPAARPKKSAICCLPCARWCWNHKDWCLLC